MIITKTALELTKRYAAGASCEIDFQNIEHTMFYPHYKDLAQKAGFREVRRDTVRKYWFTIHNGIVIKLFIRGKYSIRQADNCLVNAGVITFIPPVSGWNLEINCRQLGHFKKRLFLSANLVSRNVKRGGLRKVEKGDWITVHGGIAAEVITKEEADFLIRKTEEIIESLNKGSK